MPQAKMNHMYVEVEGVTFSEEKQVTIQMIT
jgi:hypothetical protein